MECVNKKLLTSVPVRLAGDLDLELVTKPIPRKLGFLSAIAPLSDSLGLLSNVVVVKVRTFVFPCCCARFAYILTLSCCKRARCSC